IRPSPCILVEGKKFRQNFLVVNIPLERFQNTQSQEKDTCCGTLNPYFGKGGEKTAESSWA
ncbi:unnamed protein product, partial [marine sediment metagenome]